MGGMMVVMMVVMAVVMWTGGHSGMMGGHGMPMMNSSAPVTETKEPAKVNPPVAEAETEIKQ